MASVPINFSNPGKLNTTTLVNAVTSDSFAISFNGDSFRFSVPSGFSSTTVTFDMSLTPSIQTNAIDSNEADLVINTGNGGSYVVENLKTKLGVIALEDEDALNKARLDDLEQYSATKVELSSAISASAKGIEEVLEISENDIPVSSNISQYIVDLAEQLPNQKDDKLILANVTWNDGTVDSDVWRAKEVPNSNPVEYDWHKFYTMNVVHNHDDIYYRKQEIDNTVNDINNVKVDVANFDAKVTELRTKHSLGETDSDFVKRLESFEMALPALKNSVDVSSSLASLLDSVEAPSVYEFTVEHFKRIKREDNASFFVDPFKFLELNLGGEAGSWKLRLNGDVIHDSYKDHNGKLTLGAVRVVSQGTGGAGDTDGIQITTDSWSNKRNFSGINRGNGVISRLHIVRGIIGSSFGNFDHDVKFPSYEITMTNYYDGIIGVKAVCKVRRSFLQNQSKFYVDLSKVFNKEMIQFVDKFGMNGKLY